VRSGFPDAYAVDLGGEEVQVRVRLSNRAHRLAIRFLPTGFELVVPRRTSVRAAETFLGSQTGWIARQRDRQPVRDDSEIWYLGRQWRFTDGTGEGIVFDDAAGTISGVDLEVVAAELRNLSRRALAEDLRLHAARMGYEDIKLSVRDQTSKWGSCSSRRSISLNWRLIMCPPEVRHYVVIHELAHLSHMNHGPDFWELVERFCPDYRQLRRWLRVHGHEILAWKRGGNPPAATPQDAD